MGEIQPSLKKLKHHFRELRMMMQLNFYKRRALTDIAWGDDFGAPHETAIAEHYDKPVFITKYPTSLKPFYMQPDENREEVVLMC